MKGSSFKERVMCLLKNEWLNIQFLLMLLRAIIFECLEMFSVILFSESPKRETLTTD